MSDEPQLSSSETYQLSTPRLRSSLQSPPRSPLQHDVRSSHGLESNLSELPPTPTLEGLAASSASAADGGYSVGRLDSIVAQASMADRELAARTTLASKQLRQWYAEVSSWEWPAVGRPGVSTGFEVPNKEERASKPRNFSDELNERDGNLQGNVHMLDLNGTPMQETFKSGDGQQQTDGVEEEYWGGCPARLVEQYQDRIDAIAAGIVELDLGDLQDRVLDAHIPSRAGHSYSQETYRDTHVTTSLPYIDDITAVITGTLLQALPYLARLSRLLETWSIRLSILRTVPYFLKDLEDAQIAMQSGWDAIGLHPRARLNTGKIRTGNTPATDKGFSVIHVPGAIEPEPVQAGTQFAQSDLTIDGFKTIDKILSDKIVSTGQKLDSMLDALEGREDNLPREWIQEMEQLEKEYSEWVCEAERVVFDNELRKTHVKVKSAKPKLDPSAQSRLDSSQADDIDATTPERQIRTPDEETPLIQSTAPTCLPTATYPGDMSSSDHNADLRGALETLPILGVNGLESITSDVAAHSSSTTEGQTDRSSTEPTGETEHITSPLDFETELFPPQTGISRTDDSLQSEPNSDVDVHQSGEVTMLRPRSAPPNIPYGALSLSRCASNQKDPTDKMIHSPPISNSMATSASTSYPLKLINDVDVRYNLSRSKDRASPTIKGYSSHNSHVAPHLPALKLNTTDERTGPQNESDLGPLQSSPEIPFSQRDPGSKRPAAIIVEDSVKETMTAPSSASSCLSDLSSSELQDAFAAIIGKPVIVTSRPTSFTGSFTPVRDQFLNDNAGTHVRSQENVYGNTAPQPFENSKKHQMQNINHLYPSEVQHDRDSEEDDPDLLTPRRASLMSMASMEVVDRASVKSIDVRKRRSQPALASTPSKISQASQQSPHLMPVHTGRPRNSSVSEVASLLASKDVNTTPGVNPSETPPDPDPSQPVSAKPSEPQPLSKRQVMDPNKEVPPRSPNIGRSERSFNTHDSFVKSPARKSQDMTREEQLEQKISSILTTIPAQIRLTSEDDPGVNEASKQLSSGTPSAPRSRKTPTPSPNSYTLAPAKAPNLGSSKTAATETGNSEVRLYHLRRGGVEASAQAPIRLLVRLVGSENNERVMVRVGGGWSELGDYLREYAIHHNTNRRSVSDTGNGLMEVKQMPITGMTSTNTPSSTTRQYNASRYKEGTTPGSSKNNNNNANSSTVGGGQRSSRRSISSSIPGTPITPSPTTLFTNNIATPSSVTNKPSSTNRPPSRLSLSDRTTTADDDSRPNSSSSSASHTVTDSIARNSGRSRRPSTNGSNSRLSAEKQAWVEAMIGRVKRTTASHKTSMTTISNPNTPVTTTHTKTNKGVVTSSTPTNANHSKSNSIAAFTPLPTTDKDTTIDASTNPPSRTSSRKGESRPSTTESINSTPESPVNPLSNRDMDTDIISFGDLGTIGKGRGRGSGPGVEGGGGSGGGGIRRVYPRRQLSTKS